MMWAGNLLGKPVSFAVVVIGGLHEQPQGLPREGLTVMGFLFPVCVPGLSMGASLISREILLAVQL